MDFPSDTLCVWKNKQTKVWISDKFESQTFTVAWFKVFTWQMCQRPWCQWCRRWERRPTWQQDVAKLIWKKITVQVWNPNEMKWNSDIWNQDKNPPKQIFGLKIKIHQNKYVCSHVRLELCSFRSTVNFWNPDVGSPYFWVFGVLTQIQTFLFEFQTHFEKNMSEN